MASLSINATIHTTEDTYAVSTNSYDIYVAEQAFGTLDVMKGESSFTSIAQLLWAGSKRLGRAGDDFEAWLQEVDIDFEDDEDSAPKDPVA